MTPHPPTVACRDDRARRDLGDRPGRDPDWNGIDAVEVEPRPGPGATLRVYLIRRLTADFLAAARPLPLESVAVSGGRRVRDVRVTQVAVRHYPPGSAEDDYLEVAVDPAGDFSTYTLSLNPDWFPPAARGGRARYPDRFDPVYSRADFRFHPDCPPADPPVPCPAPPPPPEPAIDYLARDYAGFRRLLLDRLAVVLPGWTERHAPDLGVALVELLAYVGDYLSYFQDAVATEAYLGTARLRTSVRRHARLIDYPMHDGCNARAWVWVEVADPADPGRTKPPTPVDLPPGTPFLTADAGDAGPAFEVLATHGRPKWVRQTRLHRDHSRIEFYTWDHQECCLPCGATGSALRGRLDRPARPDEPEDHCGPPDPDVHPPVLFLQPGDFLLLEEVVGPRTGLAADADPSRKHVVVLTRVEPGFDPVAGKHYVQVTWDARDALPFDLCLSAVVPYEDAPGGDRPVTCAHRPTAVARGNVLLVDHGRTVREELPPVPTLDEPPDPPCLGEGRPAPVERRPGAYRPALGRDPVTRRQDLPATVGTYPPAAAALLDQDPREAMPQVWLAGGGLDWVARRDLLASGPRDPHFVAEADDDARAVLRFGDGVAGRRPPAGAAFRATYRVGNGAAGNVGAGAITRLGRAADGPVVDPGYALAVHQPFPARGGTDPEPLEDVRQLAPDAFVADQRRLVLADDYARAVARRFPEVQRAAAAVRSVGGRDLVVLAVDFLGRVPAAARGGLLAAIERAVAGSRPIGQRVRAREARAVPLAVDVRVTLRPTALRGPTTAALREVLGSRPLPGGRRGFFHPDNLTFGQGVAKSRLVALAQSVQGVESVEVTRLGRLGPVGTPAAPDFFPVGPLEIARLDDPNRREGGRLRLDVRGGR